MNFPQYLLLLASPLDLTDRLRITGRVFRPPLAGVGSGDMRQEIFPTLREASLLLLLTILIVSHQLPPTLRPLVVELGLEVFRALPEHVGQGVEVADHEDEEKQGGDDDTWRGDVVQHPVQAEGESH